MDANKSNATLTPAISNETDSGLIRRARLIRRQTTKHYCQNLCSLNSTSFISQILILKLKPRPEANDFERLCVNTSNSSNLFIPSIEFSYPSIESKLSKFPPPLFYPDFMRETIQRRENDETFQVVLTDEKGNRTFAYCFKFLNQPISSLEKKKSEISRIKFSILVFISHYPYDSVFYTFASYFILSLRKGDKSLAKIAIETMSAKATSSDIPLNFATNEIIRWVNPHVSNTLQTVGIENALLVFLCLLAEKRIIVTGTNVTEVSHVVKAFVQLLSPLEWPHTLIPVIPDSQPELCHNPTPYICGILRYNLSLIRQILCPCPSECESGEDPILFDVERGFVIPYLKMDSRKNVGLNTIVNFSAMMGFPKSMVVELLSELRKCIPFTNPLKADQKIQKKVMKWYAKLFGHFRNFGRTSQQLLTVKNRKLFVRAHPSPEIRQFLKWFTENGILQQFMFTQNNATSINPTMLIFYKILDKYSPPVTKSGKRRKAKSLVWRIFKH